MNLVTEGVLPVQRYLEPEVAMRLREIAQWSYDLFDVGGFSSQTEAASRLRSSHSEWNGLCIGYLVDFLSEVDGESSKSLKGILAHLQSPRLRLDYSFFRRCVVHRKGGVAWHCDAEAAGMLSLAGKGHTVWMPLDEVGEKLPSLEFVLGSHKVMRERKDLKQGRHHSHEWVGEIPGIRWIPQIRTMGDAVMFDMYMLHRTQQLQSETPRLSCEFRFVFNPQVLVSAAAT